ncbi:aminotransferase class III-fold pyridoxal phosphate-dependent enzyme [Sinorhizobium sp. 8-89]|uniref:aminotransferase class III-fold pyridoxal phosphate-dependent enzyme n=1 Tax=Sinorhizobium sp. 7-81 TaxID=3049087 RepID=UPI0024C20FD4|nr:aminotransferase class III-fold pyridoxal phosphate-dependent enzyme [Sinorhizobium sp. 7-81]MDK1389365.1 aminotransferase class III-fold pyridoxal phosphate-dependent enzyme [Sinorhizobium sp. 7-81]
MAEWERETPSSIIFRSANGAIAQDVDGKIYLDMTSCSGASPLGSNNTVFKARLAQAMERETDVLPSPVSEQRQILAGKISKMFPDTPRVFFLRTGSCATEAAVRIARHRTGRPVILTAGFHGWHDIFQQPPWSHDPPAKDPHIQDYQYDLDILEQQLTANEGRVAGIFFTPEPSVFPPELLQEISRMARQHGVLLIVDEVLCGLRYAEGGYCRKHGVAPDVITLAKGIAQGIGLSAVAGTTDAMAGADRAYLGNTYLRENRAFVAGNLTQEIFAEAKIVERLAERGSALKGLFQISFERSEIPARVLGSDTMFDIVLPSQKHGRAFAQRCLKHGIYTAYPGTYMSNASMDGAFFRALQAALELALADYRKDEDITAQVTDTSMVDYCAEAFHATEKACLSSRKYWFRYTEASRESHDRTSA